MSTMTTKLTDKYKSHVSAAQAQSGGSLYHTGFDSTPRSSSRSTGNKCTLCCTDPLKLAIILGTLSLIINFMSTTITTTTVNERLEAMEQIPSTYGITNVNDTYYPGGYYGWYYRAQYPDLYPLADLHVSPGDRIFFTSRQKTFEDLWIVDEDVYETCQFLNTSFAEQLSVAAFLRGGSYEKNETCDEPGVGDCTEQGWILNTYPYNEEGGYTFLVQDWHVRDYGNPLYFASARDWNKNDQKNAGCKNGVKLKVFVETRAAIPFYVDDGSEFDLTATETVQDLKASIGHLSRMLILMHFNFEQRIRSEGDSGLTNVRGQYDGDAAYDDGTYTNGAVASIHNHADNILLNGIGEIQAVLNGVEFRSRHNDYNLNMPSTTSGAYHAVEAIPQPDVPPEVLEKNTVDEQVEEMLEWFRAWKDQDITHRDYRPYFKPILCYIEGTWITDENSLEEPFESDRHAIDAKTWKQLHDQIRWMSNSGRKQTREDLAHLPSAIRNLDNDTYPIVSNFEYRILCHPLKNDVPTSRLRVVDDLSIQLMGSPETREEMTMSRRARFELNRYIDPLNPDDDHIWSPGRKKWNYLDYLMEQIPGKNNYGCNMTDEMPDGSEVAIHPVYGTPINACYYSRFYSLHNEDAMGSTYHRRGFSDRNLFAAKTTQEKVSPIQFDFDIEDDNGTVIETHHTVSKWSYAIPLELVYKTPLSNWNPYGIEYKEKEEFDFTRKGTPCDTDPFDGWTEKNAYFTPGGMFTGAGIKNAGDTISDNVCAIGSDGEPHAVYPSGHWIAFPEMPNGIGQLRQRYPIFPLHVSGHGAFKEVKALQAVVLPDDYDDPVTNPDGFFGDDRDQIYGFEINLQGGGHQHIVYIPGYKVRNKWYDDDGNELSSQEDVIEAVGDTAENHEHTIEVWRERDSETNEWIYHVKRCRFGDLSDEGKFVWTDDECEDLHSSLKR